MKARYFFLLAAMVLLASCSKELAAPEISISKAKTVIEVGISPATKTYLGDADAEHHRKVYWSNGDQIAVNGAVSAALEGLADDTASAPFTFNAVLNTPYKIVYPASIYTDETHVTLPAVQDYDASGFADGMFPMAGYSADGSGITLQHLCAVVKISVLRAAADADVDNLVSVRFKGRNNEQVSGTFTIDYQNAAIAPSSSPADAEKVVKVVKSQATSTSEAAVYYIVVPAGTYTNGFDILVQDKNGHVMTKSKTSSWTAEAGKLYSMSEFTFVPTSTEIGIVISNAAEFVTFAQDYNDGDYAGQEDLVVTLTANIDFNDGTANADFAATGGIGTKKGDFGTTEDNYFLGVFNGNGMTVSNFSANVPLFKYTRTATVIENVTLDNTCSFTINSPSSDTNHGVLVGYNKGTVKDCTSNASVIINNIQDVTTASQNYGGLVGYNKGTVDGCSMGGNITCSQTGQTITANDAKIGGIVGYQGEDGGTINNCSFTGNITISDATTYGGITAEKKYIYVAGILGRGEKAVVSDCTTGIDGTPKTIDARGTFVPAIGGITGWIASASDSEVKNCHNYMSLSFSSDGARANTTPARIGGIASRSAAIVKNSTNNGAISSSCNSTTLDLGGIVADGFNVSNCTNNAGGTITRSNANQTTDQANRYMYIGGIMGIPNAAGDIIDCTNHAAITSNPLGTASQTTIDMGGIVGGGNDKQIDISGCINDAEIKLDNVNESAAASTRIAIGGILGNAAVASTTVSGSNNSGKVWCNNSTEGSYGPISIGGTIGHAAASCSVTDCTNSGEILCQNPGAAISAYVDLGGIVGCAEATITISGTTADATLNSGPITVAQASSSIVYARNTEGGIIGYSNGTDTKITNCKNTAMVYCNLTGVTANNRPSYTGGIVGLLANMSYSSNAASKLGTLSGLEIGNCNNTGEINSANYNNRLGNKTAPFAGGIAGLICGASDSKASIHDCTVGTKTLYVYRGMSGGIIAYANFCTIENCTSAANMSGTNANVAGVGGIVGRLFDSSMDSCTFSGKIAKAKNIGGLVYTMSEQTTGSTITGCNVNGATLTTGTASDKTAAAVLVSITDDKDNTITGCGVKGTLDGAAINLSSNMITADGGATVLGTYLL